MDAYESRNELRRMSRRGLFKLVLNQRISNCLVGRRPCGFILQYKENNFCVSEILRKGCQVQRPEQLEQRYDEKGGINFSLLFRHKMETGVFPPGKKAVEFKIYHRDSLTHEAIFLGRIIEKGGKREEITLKAY